MANRILQYTMNCSILLRKSFLVIVFACITVNSITREEVMRRAEFWMSRNVPYSQSATYPSPEGVPYRSDCSGFVSMAWKLSPSGIGCPWTGNLGTYCNRINKGDLSAGDILLNTAQHVTLFERWADDGKSRYWAYEEVDVGINMKHRIKNYPGNDYYPCRYKYIDGTAPDTPVPSSSSGICRTRGGECIDKGTCSRSGRTPTESIDGSWSCPNDGNNVWCCLGATASTGVCAQRGGHCISKRSCSGNAVEKIDGAWSCPGTPNDVWCCLNAASPSSTSKCANAGGSCINKNTCSANPVEKIHGAWSCPNDPTDVWCCLPGGGFVVGGVCAANGGRCISRESCNGNAVEKIDGSWSCPGTPDNVWCCLGGGGGTCAGKGGQCVDRTACKNSGKTPHERIGSGWGCPNDPDNVWCCI